MSRFILAVSAAALLLALSAPPANAYVYSAHRLYVDSLYLEAVRMDDFDDSPPERGMGWELYRDLDELPLYSAEMIRDEHWLELVSFERDTTTILPLLSAQMYILYSRVLNRHLQAAEAEQKSRIYRQLPAPGIPLMLKLLFPGYVEQETSLGLLQGGGGQRGPVGRPSGILGWLFEDEGVFSGYEWSWENFLPRILSVTALVVVGLLFIEFLRFLVILGIRSIGNVDRKRPS